MCLCEHCFLAISQYILYLIELVARYWNSTIGTLRMFLKLLTCNIINFDSEQSTTSIEMLWESDSTSHFLNLRHYSSFFFAVSRYSVWNSHHYWTAFAGQCYTFTVYSVLCFCRCYYSFPFLVFLNALTLTPYIFRLKKTNSSILCMWHFFLSPSLSLSLSCCRYLSLLLAPFFIPSLYSIRRKTTAHSSPTSYKKGSQIRWFKKKN